jgi:hypothetical protein
MKPIFHIAAVGGGIAIAATVFFVACPSAAQAAVQGGHRQHGLPTKKAAHFTMKMAAFQRQIASVRSFFRS